MLSITQMKSVLPKLNWDKAQAYIPSIPVILPKFGIDTPLRKAHFMSQMAHESGGLHFSEENLNYSAQALANTWPSRYALNPKAKIKAPNSLANKLAKKPQLIANNVYANRMGNGSEASGDGWKFRGRGLIQLTGRANYQKFGQANGVDCVKNPDLLLQPEWALTSACWFWKNNNLNKFADQDDIRMVTKLINGGSHGLLDRERYLASFKQMYQI